MTSNPATKGEPAPDTQLVTMGETMALLTHPLTTPLRHAQTLDLSVGGSESNVSIAAARLGVRTAWVGRVGSDEFGQMVLREVRAEGVHTLSRQDAGRPTRNLSTLLGHVLSSIIESGWFPALVG